MSEFKGAKQLEDIAESEKEAGVKVLQYAVPGAATAYAINSIFSKYGHAGDFRGWELRRLSSLSWAAVFPELCHNLPRQRLFSTWNSGAGLQRFPARPRGHRLIGRASSSESTGRIGLSGLCVTVYALSQGRAGKRIVLCRSSRATCFAASKRNRFGTSFARPEEADSSLARSATNASASSSLWPDLPLLRQIRRSPEWPLLPATFRPNFPPGGSQPRPFEGTLPPSRAGHPSVPRCAGATSQAGPARSLAPVSLASRHYPCD